MKLIRLSQKEFFRSFAIATTLFLIFGTITALWQNPFFVRMTPNGYLDTIILMAESILIGLYMGIQTPSSCRHTGSGTTAGGVLGFLGFSCVLCNKLLVLIFGASFLLSYIEPIRYYLGFIGIFVMGYFLYKKVVYADEVKKHH